MHGQVNAFTSEWGKCDYIIHYYNWMGNSLMIRANTHACTPNMWNQNGFHARVFNFVRHWEFAALLTASQFTIDGIYFFKFNCKKTAQPSLPLRSLHCWRAKNFPSLSHVCVCVSFHVIYLSPRITLVLHLPVSGHPSILTRHDFHRKWIWDALLLHTIYCVYGGSRQP